MKKIVYLLSLLLIGVLITSCLGFPMGASEEGEAYYEGPPVEKAMAEPSEAPAASARAESGVIQPEFAAVESTNLEPAHVGEQPTERKQVFSGFCTLVVDDVETTRTQIADIADRSGGYVETVAERTIVIRVPAERFDEMFEFVLGLGEVRHKSIETHDVTDFFRDQEIRLEIAMKTRERLYALLEKTGDVEERLKILREIKRLTEEIERIERSLELLARRVNLSRITVEITPRLPETGYDTGQIPFPWISDLNPLYPSLRNPKVRIELELSADFAVFSKELGFRAESAEGTRVRMGSARNLPRGDTEFWRNALSYHLGPFYKKEEIDLGSFKAVLLTSKDPEPFSYLVAVAAEKDDKILSDLLILEVFFPDQSALQNRLSSMKQSVEQIELK